MSVRTGQPATGPSLSVVAPDGECRGVALVLPGGKADSFEPTEPRQLTTLRMRPIARALFHGGQGYGIAVATVRYRYRGWNGAAASPTDDGLWALDELKRRYPGVPAVLVGHSMGGRAAVWLGCAPGVRGVIALAPWLPDTEPTDRLVGQQLLIAHGNWDVVTSPKASLRFAGRASRAGARVARAVVLGDTHAMLFRWSTWHRLVSAAGLGMLGLAEPSGPWRRVLERGDSGDFSVPV